MGVNHRSVHGQPASNKKPRGRKAFTLTIDRGLGKYSLLLLPCVLLLLPGVVWAKTKHPSCYYSPTCYTPQPPDQPTVSENPSVDGSYTVSVSSWDVYGWIDWNSDGHASGGTLSVSNAPAGTHSYRARQCIYSGSYDICSGWSPSVSVYAVPAPGKPSFESFLPNACNSSLTVQWKPGSGYYSSAASKRYDLQKLSNGNWGPWITNTTSVSKPLSGTGERAEYQFRAQSYFYLYGEYSRKSGWTYSSYTMPECPPEQPASPTVLQPNPDTDTTVNVNWIEPDVDVGDILCYRVQRRNVTLSSAWTALGDSDCTTSNTNYIDNESHARGQTYEYRVQARKYTEAGSSPWSSASSITIAFAQPSTPSTPAFSNVAPYGYTVNWGGGGNGNTGPITYKLWEKIGSQTGAWTNMGTATSQPYSGRTPATTYQYKVQACNGNATPQCADSAINSISFPGTPGAVTIENIGNAGRNYTLSWSAAAGDATSYELRQSIDGGQNWPLVPNLDSVPTGETIGNATAGTGYQYKVRACNSLACGVYGAVVSYWVPQTPTNLAGSANPNTPSVTVTWTGNSQVDHYELQQSTNGGSSWGPTVSVGGTSYSPAGETNGTDYTYRVRACNSQGACSPYTNTMTIRLPYVIPASPAAPTINVNNSAGTLNASWPAVSGYVETYKVEQSTNGTTWTQVQNNSSRSYAPGGLTGGTTYYLRVLACHVDGCSNPGAAASAYLPYAAPSLPDLASTGGQISTGVYGAGWSGDYAINWASGGGVVDTITVEEQEPGGVWQAASLTAAACSTGQCSYNKPPNYSGDTLSYRYRAQACNTDNCSGWKEITVQVNAYLLPGVPASFTVSQGPTTAGDYTLRWTRPAGTEDVHYYYLDNVDTAQNPDFPAITHDSNQPYFERSFSGGQSGQTYHYRVRACYQDDNGCDAYTAPLDVYIPYPAPNQPGSLSHSNLDPQTGSYTLSWTAPAGEVDYYELQRQVDDGQWLAETTTSLTAHTVNAHPNGETHSYRVRACNADDCGDYTDPHAVYVPHLEPGLPADLAIQSMDAAERRMTLGWNVPTSGGQAQTYELQQSTDDGSNWTALADTASPVFNATGLINGTTYYFRVRACNVDACGDYGASVQGYLPYAAPGTPGAISHNAAENNPPAGAFTVHWAVPAVIDPVVAPVTHYQLDYSVNGGLNWQPAPVGAISATTYVLIGLDGVLFPVSVPVTENSGFITDTSVTLSGLTTGAYYSVRVRACNADACGQSTEPYQVYLPHPAPSTPGIVPTEPSAADHASRRFTVQWTAPLTGTVNHYQLEAYAGVINGDENWPTVVDKTPATAYTFTDRAYGQTYRYRVRACSEAESSAETCSAWAVTEDIRLKYPVPNTPGGVAVSDLNQASGSYTLAWNGVLGWAPAYRYELQENLNGAGWQSLTTLVDPAHEFPVSGRAAGTYAYRVRACNPAPDNDCGGWSPVETVTILPTPTAPASLAVDDGDGQSCEFNLAWTPPTGGQGSYHYQLEVRLGEGGDYANLAWTVGTSHDLMVNPGDAGIERVFRVRARTLSNGQYSPWGPWRSTAAVTTSCDYSWLHTDNQLYISGPKHSQNGQYAVSMQYNGNWAPGLQYRYEVSTDEGNTWSGIGPNPTPPGVAGVAYDASHARPTGRYRYRVSVCDWDVGTGYDPYPTINCGNTVNSNWDSISLNTTVLREPGGVGPLQIAGLPDPIDGAYVTVDGQVTLDWSIASNVPAPATREYEIQYKPDHLTGEDDWRVWAEQSTVGLQLALPEFGVPFNFRVRACAHLDDYTHCGGWSKLTYPVKQSIGPPRFAVNAYPADGKLVIYDRRVPLQWLPPWDMADGGIHHYEISLRSWVEGEDGEFWVGPDVLSTPAPVTGSDTDPPLQQAMVEIEQGGQKEFLIRACGSSSPTSCGDALTFPITVIVPPDAPEAPDGLVGQSDPDMSAGEPFNGALSGQFSVQPSGAATYALPIIVPPGTAGVQPEISLNYSSQAGNGIAGRGWSIGGLSAINRCNKTEAQDGEAHAVDYSNNDAYCLDGQRLIEIGTNSYRTEKNDFRRITRMTSGGACGGVWFEIKTQAGETLQYGKTADACIMNTQAQAALQWALNQVTDAVDNYMLYKYVAPAEFNTLVIKQIEYTGRENGPPPYTAVAFEYEARPDLISGYQAGLHSSQRKRLAEIRTGAGRYILGYAGDNDPVPSSRLQSVKYCAFDPAGGPEQCMEPLNFIWHQDEPGWSKLPSAWTPPYPFVDEYGRDKGARLIDIDGDGLSDLIYASPSTSAAFRNTGSGWQSWPAATLPANLKFVDSEGRDRGLRFADLEGDGRPELLDNDGKAYHFTTTWDLGIQTHDLEFANGEGKDQGVRLADLDGDGRPDLIRGYNNEREARYTKGNGWSAPGQSFPGNFVQAFNGQTIPNGSELADVNGDGLVDMVKVTLGSPPNPDRVYSVWLNNGNGWSGNGWSSGSHHLEIYALPDEGIDPYLGSDIGMRLMDINADGLPDLIRANARMQRAYMNTGSNWDGGTGWVNLPSELRFLDYTGADTGMRVADVNGDGYPDMVSQHKTWLNPGNWRSEQIYYDEWYESTAYALPKPGKGAQLLDIDGDGHIDMLYGAPSGTSAWRSHASRFQITGVSDGLGNTTEIKYKALTDRRLDGRSTPIYTRADSVNYPSQQEMIIPLRVVDRVTVNDGIGGELTTEYAYKGLTAANGGRGLEHFREVTTISPNGQVSVTRFGQAFPYTGMPLQIETRYGQNGPLISRSTNEYCYSDSSDAEAAGFTSVDPDAPCPAYNDSAGVSESLFVYVKKTTIETNQLNSTLDGVEASMTAVTRNTYGRYGYLSHSEITTTGDGHTYRTETDNVYESDTDRHWLGRLTRATVTKTVDNDPDDNSTRVTEFEYYPSGLLWKEIVEPQGVAPQKLVTVHAYDQYGNTVETTVCAKDSEFGACDAQPGSPNAGSPGRSSTTVYDAQGRYPVSSSNALDQTETYTHNHPLGLRTSLTGPNGLQTTWTYDPLGRKESETTVFGTTTFEYRKPGSGYVPGAAYRVETRPPAGAPVREYYDSLGRKRRTLTQNLLGEWVAADTEYDRFGRVKRESRPYFVYTTVSGDAHWTVNEYDDLGRPIRVEVPLGDIDGDGADDGMAVSTTDYLGFETVVTDPRGRRTLEKRDVLDRTVRRIDDYGGLNITVDYEYDSQGNLTRTVVDKDNRSDTAITIDYDSRGNKTSMDDPDMGHWEYRYNGYGELVWQQDAKDQVTEIDYDQLGRMVERRETPAGGTLQTSIWKYDTASGKGIGKLHWETGPHGSKKTYSYNDPGNRGLLVETKYEAGMSGLMESFYVGYEYDEFGRVEMTHYPQVGGQRLTVKNVYSPHGGLWYVLDASGSPADPGDDKVYWIAQTVDERGQIVQETLRNQNTINRQYNRANGWLLKVESWDANLDMIQQTRYGFDKAGNVAYRERFRPWIVNPDGSFHAGQTEEVSETFTYDSLDRITSATVARNGVPETPKTYGYDRLGNFEYKDDINNVYGYTGCMAGSRPAGPHAVCNADGTGFTYDANGNLTESTGAKARTLEYSAFNKPEQITENGHTVHFYYGADRSRMFKVADPNSQGQKEYTWYVGLGPEGGALYEQKALVDADGIVVKREHLHFLYAGGYHNGQPFAVRVQEEDNHNVVRYDGTEYYHRDHLGSVIAVTRDLGVTADAAGDMHASLLSFDAFGKRRNVDWSDTPGGTDQYSPSSRGNLDYTGHEAITEVGLIHMNGRVYDPGLGVFLSADPNIQAASMSQNYHRYSYVLNNPLKYNDPSGYFFSMVMALVVSATIDQIAVQMVAIAIASLMETKGDLRTALITAVSAGVANGIGTLFKDAATFGQLLGKSLVHGFTQGMFSAAMGGDFRSGFVGGFMSSITGRLVPKGVVEGTLVSAMIGGTISELTGGKFRNGARSAAIVHLFNDLAKNHRKKPGKVTVYRDPEGAYGTGHVGAIIHNEDGTFTRYSQGAENPDAPIQDQFNGKQKAVVHKTKLSKLPSLPEEDMVSITVDDINAVSAAAESYRNSPQTYNAITNNCADFVDYVLSAGNAGVIFESSVPNIYFDQLRFRESTKNFFNKVSRSWNHEN